MLSYKAKLFLLLYTVCLGICSVVFWNRGPQSGLLTEDAVDFKTSAVPYSTVYKRDIEEILKACCENESQHQILQNRLQLLQKFIPSHYSTYFRNPCWYDRHKTPTFDISKPKHTVEKQSNEQVNRNCDIPLFYKPSLAKFSLKQAKNVGQMHLHCLPSFFFSGFSKCASTSLYRMIIQHPQIAQPKCKENNFWRQFVNQQGTNDDKRMQILQYLNNFSPCINQIEADLEKITLDASISYHASSTDSDFCILPKLLMRVLPEAKFIVLMRNPSERVLSHYFYYLRKHFSSQAEYSSYVSSRKALNTLHHQISNVIMRFQSCIDSGYSTFSCVRNRAIDDKNTRYYYVGLQTSMYYYHLLPWVSIVPRERFLFLRTEDLISDNSLTMSRVWHFLHLKDFQGTKEEFAKVNEHPSFPVHTKKLLDRFFQPHNKLLANLLSDSKYLWKDL